MKKSTKSNANQRNSMQIYLEKQSKAIKINEMNEMKFESQREAMQIN